MPSYVLRRGRGQGAGRGARGPLARAALQGGEGRGCSGGRACSGDGSSSGRARAAPRRADTAGPPTAPNRLKAVVHASRTLTSVPSPPPGPASRCRAPAAAAAAPRPAWEGSSALKHTLTKTSEPLQVGRSGQTQSTPSPPAPRAAAERRPDPPRAHSRRPRPIARGYSARRATTLGLVEGPSPGRLQRAPGSALLVGQIWGICRNCAGWRGSLVAVGVRGGGGAGRAARSICCDAVGSLGGTKPGSSSAAGLSMNRGGGGRRRRAGRHTATRRAGPAGGRGRAGPARAALNMQGHDGWRDRACLRRAAAWPRARRAAARAISRAGAGGAARGGEPTGESPVRGKEQSWRVNEGKASVCRRAAVRAGPCCGVELGGCVGGRRAGRRPQHSNGDWRKLGRIRWDRDGEGGGAAGRARAGTVQAAAAGARPARTPRATGQQTHTARHTLGQGQGTQTWSSGRLGGGVGITRVGT
jgi:hypothetical protein